MPFALTLGTVSFFIAVIWGRPLIALLKRYGVGKQIRIEQPDRLIVRHMLLRLIGGNIGQMQMGAVIRHGKRTSRVQK